MVTIRIFDCNGVKTVQLQGNANEQPYDPIEVVEEDVCEPESEPEE